VQGAQKCFMEVMKCFGAGAGVDGVKVDCQSTLDMIGSSLGGGPALAAGYHAALEDSVADNFPGNACINCMCHSTSDLYRHDRQLDVHLVLSKHTATMLSPTCVRCFSSWCSQLSCCESRYSPLMLSLSAPGTLKKASAQRCMSIEHAVPMVHVLCCSDLPPHLAILSSYLPPILLGHCSCMAVLCVRWMSDTALARSSE
jgi:hypothetical protein